MPLFSRSAPDVFADRLRRLRDRVRNTPVRNEGDRSATWRTIDELAAAIHDGEAAALDRMEWIRLCGGRRAWSLSPHEAARLARAIWTHAADDPDTSRLLLWRAALYYAGRTHALQQALWEAFQDGDTAYTLGNAGTLLLALIQRKFSSLAHVAHNNEATPRVMFQTRQLPTRPDVLRPVHRHTSTVFLDLEHPTTSDTKWYIRCLEESPTALKVKAAERLLRELQSVDGSGGVYRPLREWLRTTFNPSSTNDLWTDLSSEGKRLLRSWLGAATYSDFETVADLVLDRVSMEHWQDNQLRKRRDFWKNYSDNYLRVRILIPGQSRRLIESPLQQKLGSDKDIGRLDSDGSEATEVCIFDFGPWYIVEFFRGSASEMRLFEADPLLERLFFSGALPVSAKRIRALPDAQVFDHKYLWQPMCERWLQEHDIYVNEGLTEFLMSRETGWHQSYDPDRNLPFKRSDLPDRENGLKRWRKKVQKLEKEARRWVQRNGVPDAIRERYKGVV